MKPSLISATALLLGIVIAATPDEWRSQSIYFLLTDRFGRTDNSTTAACDTSEQVCCLVSSCYQ
jgi:alpha-amylase